MKVGIGLPHAIRNVPGSLIREWARLADEGPFSSLVAVDRVVYDIYEPLTTLAVMAGATRRIRLMTGVLLAPLRNAGILAKEVATLDALSNGRLTLGLGIGAREDDFRAAPASFHDRGKRFEQQLELMTRIWSGRPVDDQTGAVGPTPVQQGGPEVLIGAYSPTSINRVERWGNGYMFGGPDPKIARGLFRQAEEAWQRADRPGKPRLVVCGAFALGRDAAAHARAYILDYHAYLGAAAADASHAAPSTPEAVRENLQAFEEIGADEVVLMPCIPELDQVHMLAECLA